MWKMWNWIKENSDWICFVTFGRLPPIVRLVLGILYEIFDYTMRVVALFIPGLELTILDGPYIFVCILLAGGEGTKWAFWDFGFSFIPLGDWFPGLTIACWRIWRGYAPDPGQRVFQRKEKRGGQKMGCLTYQFRIFLTVLFTAASIYFGGRWGYSALVRDYRDQAWEQIKDSPRGIWARGRDGLEGATGGIGEAVKPWVQKGTRGLKKRVEGLSRSLGIGGTSKRRRLEDVKKRLEDVQKEKIQQPQQQPQSTTPETSEQKAEREVEKNELVKRAKEVFKLGPHASELYASETTSKVAEELREKDSAYYQRWFWRIGVFDLLFIFSLFFLPRETGSRRRLKNYISLDDDV